MSSRKKPKPLQVPEISSTMKDSSAETTQTNTDQTVSMSNPIPVFYNREPLPRKQLLVKFSGAGEVNGENETEGEVEKWYSMQYPEINESESDRSLAEKAEEYAAKVSKVESDLYQEVRAKQNPSDAKWMKTVVAGGTLSDQVAGLTVVIQESPVHNISYLRLLVNKVTRHSRREAIVATDSLKDLFIQELLPDRKLVPLKMRPLIDVESLSSGNKDTRDRRLVLWYYENELKEVYGLFVRTIEKWCHDTVDAVRLKSIKIILDLLVGKSEQEQFLLNALVNKLGDKVAKIASKVVYFLLRLVNEHPNMKTVIVEAVDKLIYRPNISPRAQHYAVCFLSQIALKRTDCSLAAKLLTIYFNLFKLMVKRSDRGELDNKLLSILLKGTNKAFPCCEKTDKGYDEIVAELDTLFKVAAVGNFNTSIQTLLLLHQTLKNSTGLTDRFYSAVYRKMSDPTVLSSNSHKHYALFFHLLYQVMNRDSNDRRILAFVKRLLQCCLCSSPPFAAASLMLLSALFGRRPSLRRTEKWGQETQEDLDDDEEEHFADTHLPESDIERSAGSDESDEERKTTATWVHRANVNTQVRSHKSTYDPSHRNPAFAGADRTLLYELHLLSSHYHPTVALFAKDLIQGRPVEYQGDPLEDFTLIRFLDRFVYRNPKKVKQNKIGDQVEGAMKTITTVPRRKRKTYNPWGVKAMTVTSDEYIQKAEEDIPVDEQYLFRFMNTAGRPNVKKKKGKTGTADDDEESDVESVASDEFEKLLEKFEPGSKNEEFDIDFSKDVSTRKRSEGKRKKKASDDESSDDEDPFDVDPDDE